MELRSTPKRAREHKAFYYTRTIRARQGRFRQVVFIAAQRYTARFANYREEDIALPRYCMTCATLLAAVLVLSGCSTLAFWSNGKNSGKPVDVYAVDYRLPLNFFAGNNLNAGPGGKPLGLVVKIYQLTDYRRFTRASLQDFLAKQSTQAALGEDLITAREITLLPGKTYRLVEDIRKGTRYLGVVALFMAPAKDHWRAVFNPRKSRDEGITIGLTACALTVTSGKLVTDLPGPPNSLSMVQCPDKI